MQPVSKKGLPVYHQDMEVSRMMAEKGRRVFMRLFATRDAMRDGMV